MVLNWLRRLAHTPRSPISVEISINTPRYEEPASAKLLKRVTEFKKAGEIDEAIEVCRQAYVELEREGGGPIEVFLRLPMLLQKAGRNEEAWSEYNRLLASDFTGAGFSRELTPMYHSRIYDKMRLFLQREGKHKQAVSFGALSMLSWGTGLHYQGRVAELDALRAPENTRGEVTKLLKKAHSLDRIDAVVAIIRSKLEEIPSADGASLTREIGDALSDSAGA